MQHEPVPAVEGLGVLLVARAGLSGRGIERRSNAVVVTRGELQLRDGADGWRNSVLRGRRKRFEEGGFRFFLARISGTLVRKIHSGLVHLAEVFLGKTETELIGELDSGLLFYGFHDSDGISVRTVGSLVALCVRSAGKGRKERGGRKRAAHESGFALRSGAVVLRHKARWVIEPDPTPIGRLSCNLLLDFITSVPILSIYSNAPCDCRFRELTNFFA